MSVIVRRQIETSETKIAVGRRQDHKPPKSRGIV
jgi:hypothetical protein